MARSLRPGQLALVHVHDALTGDDAVVHEDAEVLLEAPNWTPEGDRLLLNGDGLLWSMPASGGGAPRPVPFEGLPEINNDHVLSPDGRWVYCSAEDGHIHRGPVDGGQVERVTEEDGVWHFLHGVSPDGQRLALVRMTDFEHPGVLAVMPSSGGPVTMLDTGPGHVDGPEWSPDGRWILFNTERWADAPGHAQLARVPDGGGEVERLVTSGTVDWFPHVSPDGRLAVYLEFPAGTEGHPADRDVALVVVETEDWSAPLRRVRLPGGQGTINVSSWSPDSTRFAYVSYPTR